MKIGTNWKSFTAGHRIPWHEKCGRMHGHTFRVRALIEGEVEPSRGMVVDFSDVGKALDEIISPLDHRFLAPETALHVEKLSGLPEAGPVYVIEGKYVLPENDVVVLPMAIISTENLATYILSRLMGYTWTAKKKVTVQVSESGDNIAEVTFDGTKSTDIFQTPEYLPKAVIVPYRWQKEQWLEPIWVK